MARRGSVRSHPSGWVGLGLASNRYQRIAAEGSALGRTLAFNDAVFAIAMTILVLELHVPEVEGAELPAALLRLVPFYLTFVLTFVVVGAVWLSHHRTFGVIVRFIQVPLRLTMLMPLLVASLALPTAVLGRYGEQAIAVVLHAGFVACIGLFMSYMWLYAWRQNRVDPRVERDVFRYVFAQSPPVLVTFLHFIPVTLLARASAQFTWIISLPLFPLQRYATRNREIALSGKEPT